MALTPPRPGRLTDTVSTSLELAQGQIASGRSPFGWNTDRNWSQELRDHGFAPSATKSILSDDKLISLWSLVAKSPQWRSLDLTTATQARYFVIICIQLAGLTFMSA